MLNKYFLSAAIGVILAVSPAAGTIAMATEAEKTVVVDTLPDGQAVVAGDWANSGEVNTVEESPIARKMTQAEKAKNAAENDSWGGAITIIAMTIVLAALIILSILFLGFGKISSLLLSKKKREAIGNKKADSREGHEDVDSGEVIAAISTALAQHFSGQHDIEDTILTIRRMRKAYSPWNSKIYNLRELPEYPRNHQRPIPRSK